MELTEQDKKELISSAQLIRRYCNEQIACGACLFCNMTNEGYECTLREYPHEWHTGFKECTNEYYEKDLEIKTLKSELKRLVNLLRQSWQLYCPNCNEVFKHTFEELNQIPNTLECSKCHNKYYLSYEEAIKASEIINKERNK